MKYSTMDGLETAFKGGHPNQGIEIGKDGQGLGGWGVTTKLLWFLEATDCCGWYSDHRQCNIPAHAPKLFESNLEDRLLAEEVRRSLGKFLGHLCIDLIPNPL